MVDDTEEKYIDISPSINKGVLKQIVKPGSSEESPSIGDNVFVHYVGHFMDGTLFESTRENNDSFSFHYGKGEVIQAWELCISTMKKGEICKIISTSEFAYGDIGNLPKIPPYTDLIFEIELLSWCGADISHSKDGSIIKNILQVGEGNDMPNDGSTVKVNIVGHSAEVIFDERKDVSFVIGEGSESNLPYGLERALVTFQLGEESLIKLSSKKAFGSQGNDDLGIGPHTDLKYEVKLIHFERAKESWEMSSCQRIEISRLFKDKGGFYFKQNKFRLAAHQYQKIVNFLSYTESRLEEKKKLEARELLLAARLNLSLSYLKIKDYKHARDHASEAVILAPNNIKAIFRLGEAYLGLEEADDAQKTFIKCKHIDESNKIVCHRLKDCELLLKRQKSNEKKLFAGMFDKLTINDRKKCSYVLSSGDVMAGDLGEWKGKNTIEILQEPSIEDELKDIQMIYI